MPKACPECGSRKWRKDGVTGNAICEDGHVFQDFRSENLVAEPTTVTLQRRVDKSRGPRGPSKRSQGSANPDYYHGSNAAWLKVQAVQLMLRAQVQALKKLWSLPDIYEIVVRDLWAYHLSRCNLPARPAEATSEAETPLNLDKLAPLDTNEGEEDEKSDDDDESENSSLRDLENIDPALMDDIERISDDDQDLNPGEELPPKEGRWKDHLRASDTITCLAVALWFIRYPFLHVDLECIINTNSIPYIDFGRSTILPEDMRRRINLDVIIALCPLKSPSPLFIHHQCHKLVRYISTQYQVVVPEINLPPLAWRVISALGGTPTTYDQVIRMMRVIDLNLSLDDSEVVTRFRRRKNTRHINGNRELETYQRTTRNDDVWMPELAIVSIWVILMKMSYGLDGRQRLALSKDEPLVGLPNGQHWVDELKIRLQNGAFKGDRAYLDKVNFTTMLGVDMDAFLDRAEGVLLRDRPILRTDDLFPPPQPHEPLSAKAHQVFWDAYHTSPHPVFPSVVLNGYDNQDAPLVPGAEVRSYDYTDITGTLPEEYEVVVNTASELIGVRPRDVARAAEVLERRLVKAKPTLSRPPSRAGSRSRPPSRAGSMRLGRSVSRVSM